MVRSAPPAMSDAGSPGSAKKMKNRNERATKTVGMICRRRMM
jgi:hypothetical protein